MSYSESQVSNALVSHKNALIEQIDNAENNEALAEIRRSLDAVKECWRQLHYGYKWDELADRIARRWQMDYSVLLED